MIEKYKLKKRDFNGCMVGLTSTSGWPMLKPWTIRTSLDTMLEQFDGLLCNGTHRWHQPVQGKETAATSYYPWGLTDRAHNAWRQDAKTWKFAWSNDVKLHKKAAEEHAALTPRKEVEEKTEVAAAQPKSNDFWVEDTICSAEIQDARQFKQNAKHRMPGACNLLGILCFAFCSNCLASWISEE